MIKKKNSDNRFVLVCVVRGKIFLSSLIHPHIAYRYSLVRYEIWVAAIIALPRRIFTTNHTNRHELQF